MREIVATVTRRGQVTVPAEIRRILGAKAGDKLAFVIDETHGQITLRVPRYPDVASLRGAAGKLPTAMRPERVRKIAREDALEARARKPS
jgi:AbrB family looped-hinge helix DNA binding protein